MNNRSSSYSILDFVDELINFIFFTSLVTRQKQNNGSEKNRTTMIFQV